MKSAESSNLRETLSQAQAYLDRLAVDADRQPDFSRLHRYLVSLTPYLNRSSVLTGTTRTVARLYFESMRYADSAAVLEAFSGPLLDELQVNNDFFNGYFTTSHDWASRQKEIWEHISAAAEKLDGGGEALQEALSQLRRRLDYLFPSTEVSARPPKDSDKGVWMLGNACGILSLVPMLYLLRHAPSAISRRWSLLLEHPGAGKKTFQINDEVLRAEDILVQVTPDPLYQGLGKVRLQVWHPRLAPAAGRRHADFSSDVAALLVHCTLPLSATALHVTQISLARLAPEGDAVPLSQLRGRFQAEGMAPDIPQEQILAHRWLSFTRTPTYISRPRGDILRGETCMPELEEIYFLRDSRGMSALQRYGVGYWFLTVPKRACRGDFPGFRARLQAHVRGRLGDKVFFTGWAEGTHNCYIDFLSLTGKSALNTLHQYIQTLPRGRDIRLCTFYWNSELRTADLLREMSAFQRIEVSMATHPDSVRSPKDQTSPEDQRTLEQTFRETQWSPMPVQAQADLEADGPSPTYSDAMWLLEETEDYIQDSDSCETDASLDFVRLHSCLQTVLSAADPADMEREDRDRLALVLNHAERFRESARLASRSAAEHQYACDLGSSYPKYFNQWEPRRRDFWIHFAAAETALIQQIDENGDPNAISDFRLWADGIFPAQELTLLPGPKGKHTLLTGLPDGILTLPAMLYLTGNYSANLGKRWNIALSGDGDSVPNLVPIGLDFVPAQEVRVSLAQEDGKVSLALYHPKLAEGTPQEARDIAVQLVNCALPMGARLLFVEEIAAILDEPEDAFPLPELRQQMESAGLQTDISLDALLTRRRYTFTRAPQDTGRPRDDILRGETCMPELERIYYRLWEEGQAILERYGCNALFLMIPRVFCGEDPAALLRQLRNSIRQAEGDQVFFTGWAEGTKFCYLDLITLHGCSLLSVLNRYAYSASQGRGLQFATFYWNSKPFPWLKLDAFQQMASPDPVDMPDFIQGHKFPRVPVPDPKAAAALEASFHPAFTLADFCAPRPTAQPAAQAPSGGKKKLSKAQRKAQNAKGNAKNSGKSNKKKR